MRDNQQQFYLDISHHQNSSWQGSLQRLDTGETINFRSELEMVTLIEEALSQQTEEDRGNERFRSWNNNHTADKRTRKVMKKTGTFGQ